MQIPENVSYIINKLNRHGYEAYAVGGCVRDVLLGRTPQDWDITTSALPGQVKELFRRTIDTGIAHGTVTVMLGKEGYEVTTYRLDGEYEDHRHPDTVQFTPDLTEDLKRRDFTINAMAYNEDSGIVDKFGGQEDMKKQVIKAVGNPTHRFEEDALRMLRAIRFAGQLGFAIEEETILAIHQIAPTLVHVSAERIRVELTKLLCSNGPEQLFTAQETGLTSIFLPEFDQMCTTKQNNPHHYLDVAHHSIEVVRELNIIYKTEGFTRDKDQIILVFAGLLHDVAKPECQTTDSEGMDHFYGHDIKGEESAGRILRRLKFDNETYNLVKRMIRYHDYRYEGGKKALRRFMSKVGVDTMLYLFALQKADLLAQSEYMRKEKLERLDKARVMYQEILDAKEAVTIKDLAITGKDLMEAGVKQGPEIGNCLEKLLDYVLENPEMNQKETLMEHWKGE